MRDKNKVAFLRILFVQCVGCTILTDPASTTCKALDIFKITHRGGCYYRAHFAKEETEVQKS